MNKIILICVYNLAYEKLHFILELQLKISGTLTLNFIHVRSLSPRLKLMVS